jgi:ribosomal protein S18 acetylase RimI-like enzyme
MHCGDLEWRAFGPHGYPLGEIIEVWEDDRGIAGWVLESAASFDCQVLPELRGSDAEREMLAFGQARVLTWRVAQGLDPQCAVEVYADDGLRIAVLEAMGYHASERGGVQFAQSLDREIRAPVLDDGWEARGIRDTDIDSRAETQREAFAPGSKTTAVTWRHLMANAPGYDRDLDNVVVARDGTVVSAAMTWLDLENRVGLFEPVATRPAFQGKGFGRAVMLRGLRTLGDRGMATAIVQTNSSNAAAIALYTSVGFKEINRLVEYELAAGSVEGR